jgi:hypothetical protein
MYASNMMDRQAVLAPAKDCATYASESSTYIRFVKYYQSTHSKDVKAVLAPAKDCATYSSDSEASTRVCIIKYYQSKHNKEAKCKRGRLEFLNALPRDSAHTRVADKVCVPRQMMRNFSGPPQRTALHILTALLKQHA